MIYICILLCAFIAPFSYTFGNEISSEIIEPPPVEVSIEDSIRKKGSNEISIHVTLNNTEREFILQTVDNFAGKNTKVWIAKKVNDKFVYTLQEDFMRKSNNITFFYNNQTESEVFQTVSENGESQFNSVINYDQVDNEPINVSNLSTVYPEILVYVDKTLFRHFDYDIEKTVIYTLTLWNGVDLDFRELQNPSVRLNIAGIVLCQDQPLGNDPFRVYSKKLDEFGKFMYNQDQFKLGKDYDIAVLLGADPLFNSGTAGRAFLGSTCVNNTYEQKIASTAIILDNTAFSGINTASHELGHLFGAPHDGEKDDSTAKHCSFYDGYIMSYTTIDEKQYYFSTCSKKIMSNYLRSEAPKCIRNNPLVNETNEQMLRILPGKFMTIDEQCQRQGYLRAYDVNPVSCKTIQCKRVEPGATAFSSIAALEGTPCYIGKYCLRGECVKVNFNTTENNKHSKELFPSLSQHPTFNKSATEQCIEMGIENVTNAYFENCQVKCKFPKEGFTYSMFIDAHYGTLCSNDGYCHNGKCIGMNNSEVTDNVVPDDSIPDSINHDNTYTMPDKYITADELCQKKGYIRAVDVNPDICQSINCLKETGYIIYTNMPALEGTPCYIGKYCLRGECVEATLNTTQSLSELPKFNKTAEEQCIEMGIENVTNAYFENCQVKCKFPKEGFTYSMFIDAHYGTLCSNDGYCHKGKCIGMNNSEVTDIVVPDDSIPDSINHDNTYTMPDKYITADELCQKKGYIRAVDVNPDICQSINCLKETGYIIYTNMPALEGTPCYIGKYCLRGECVEATLNTTQSLSELPKFNKTAEEQCIEMGIENVTNAYFENCQVKCKFPKEGFTYSMFIDAHYGTLCSNDGYCHNGKCIGMNNSEVTDIVVPDDSIPDSINHDNTYTMPDKYITADELCQKKGYIRAVDVNPDICQSINCLKETGYIIYTNMPALEGTPCYIGKYCLRGECVEATLNTTQSLSELPKFNKTAEEQCIEMGIENVTNAYFENCQVKCKFPKEGFTYSMFIDAHYGTLCSNDGYCHNGKCIGMNNSEVTDIVVPDDSIPDSINHDNTYTMPDKYITADELCQKKGYIRAVDVNPDICQSINCLKETGYIIYTNMPALEGTPCYIGKYCLRGECVEATLNTTQSLSELPKFNKTAEEQCIEMGIENVTNAYFENCQVKCKFPKEGFTYYNIIDAYYGTSCGNDGYCHYGKCINVVKVTTPVVEEITDKSVPDVTDSNNTSSIMPNKFKSADEQCKEAGMLKFSNKTIKECILICEIEMDNNIDTNPYDSSSIKENIYDTSDIYKKVTAQDGFPCQENGYCQDGKCVNMTITDTNPSSTDFPLPEENSVGLPNDTTTPQSLTNFTDVKPLNDKITTPEVDVTTPKSIANDDSQIDDDKNNNDSPIFDASGLDDLIKALENDKCKADTSDDELPICEDNELSSNNLDGTNTSTIHNIITPDSNTGFHDVKSPNENITTPKVDVTTPKSISNDDSLIDDNNNNDSPIFDASGLDDLIKALENDKCKADTSDDELPICEDNELSSNNLDGTNTSTIHNIINPDSNTGFHDVKSPNENITTPKVDVTTPKSISNDDSLIDDNNNNDSPIFDASGLDDLIKALENDKCKADTSDDELPICEDNELSSNNLDGTNTSTIHNIITPDSNTGFHDVKSPNENITTPKVDVTTPKSISNDDSLIDDNNNNDSPIFDASGLDDLIKALENDNESSSNSLDELNKAIENDNKLSSKSLEDIIKMLENETCEADFSEDGCDNTTDLNSNTTFHNLVDSNNSTIHVSNPDNIQNSTDSTSSSDGLVAPLDGKTTPDSITIINNVESAENITTPFVEVTTPIVEITTPVVEVTTPVVEVPVQSTTDIDDRNIMPDNPKLYSFDKLAHEDCQKAGASGALKIYPTLCDMSCYKLPNNLTTNLTMNAPNGFPCTKGMYCQDGLCVNDDRESPVDLNKKPLLTEEGKLMLDNLACIEIGATSASKISTTDCVLHCKTTKMVKYDFMPKELYSHMYLNYNAPNGFPCGNNGICYNNTCIHQNQSKGKN
ncbi:uncharacterized protein LOC127280914 isoform X5 [Leptopilina boulardi]|uniref:uncharacterized protein LOC127280914 isoform X3 n=1 Tax=Leptopilina boulardi TaxID=63433 RepID=UPI0021F64500|nr:uncharacterized protein LOC127280914 isoform X3 [Leptopilina boulardi]XP_051160219.1 uncharacterized protein LOC127280914 isoform X5 [Leptopilina boulardi]